MSLTRKEAIEDIRMGRGIQLTFTGSTFGDGRVHTFRVIVRRSPIKGGSCQAVIETLTWRGRSYYINLTTKQVLAYIRRHYPRHDQNASNVEAIVTLAKVA